MKQYFAKKVQFQQEENKNNPYAILNSPDSKFPLLWHSPERVDILKVMKRQHYSMHCVIVVPIDRCANVKCV